MKLLVNLYMHLLLLILTTVILFYNGMPDTNLSDLQRIQNTTARILTTCGDRNYPSINLLKNFIGYQLDSESLINSYFDIQGIPQNCSTVYM